MNGTVKNKFGKTEKNKTIKAGPCIFPFKYKWKTHTECFNTPKGDICATEINPKTRTLTRYGYCEYSSSKHSSSKQSFPSALSSASSKSSSQTKTKKMKKTSKSTKSSTISRESMKSYNQDFINALSEFNKVMTLKGEPFRARAYAKAAQAIKSYGEPIYSTAQIKELPNIGKTILEKLDELIETGKIAALEREKDNPLITFTKIYGVGPKKAKDLLDKGITSIKSLREAEAIEKTKTSKTTKTTNRLLNDKQTIGLKYYEDINQRIPRAEIEEFHGLFEQVFNEIKTDIDGESTFEIVGSYRRGQETSGDIDIIITNSQDETKIFNRFLDALLERGIILADGILSRGDTKSLTIGRLPSSSVARRIDFLYSPPREYAFAVLYFTGSQDFNTAMRQHALDIGFTLNEHGISHMEDLVKGQLVSSQEFPTEKSIFDFLNLVYREPVERTGASALQKEEQKEKEENGEQTKPQTTSRTKSQTMKKSTIEPRNKDAIVAANTARFLKEGQSALDIMSRKEVEEILDKADAEYYCNNEPIFTDDVYDILRDYVAKKYPDSHIDGKQGHTKCVIEKNKVELPYEMWSMDKIKPDTKELEKYKQKYSAPYVLSAKLDGISALYHFTDSPRLYTRGNGKIGQDISHLIKYLFPESMLKQPQPQQSITLRGEIIIRKSLFEEFYSKTSANPRNFVAGLINNKTITPEREAALKHLDFVCYEVIVPKNMSPSRQFEFVEGLPGIRLVKYEIIAENSELTNGYLSSILEDWRSSYEYEIDGIICAHDKSYPRISKNPEHAFAFKMVLTDQIAEAKVVDVIWTASKHGYLKPRIQIEPISLGGVIIEYASGKNAQFIKNNKIGVGAIVKIVRSGDVIPDIKDGEIVKPANEPLFPPEGTYVWNETGIDIMLSEGDKEMNPVVLEKTITNFFKTLEVEGVGEGNVRKLIGSDHNTVAKILALSRDDFLEIDGFKERMATKLSENIKKTIEKSSLAKIAAASNIFGKGFGERKIALILDSLPEIFRDSITEQQPQQQQQQQQPDNKFIQSLKNIDGIAEKTALKFAKQIPEFIRFMQEAKLEYKFYETDTHTPDNTEDSTHPLKNKKIVMTGFRDKRLEQRIKSAGGDIQNSVSKNTFIVLVKSLGEETGKANEARKIGIPLITPEEFIEKYFQH